MFFGLIVTSRWIRGEKLYSTLDMHSLEEKNLPTLSLTKDTRNANSVLCYNTFLVTFSWPVPCKIKANTLRAVEGDLNSSRIVFLLSSFQNNTLFHPQ